MTKKIISVFLAALIALSAFVVAAYADDPFDPNAAYGIAESNYLIVPDADYVNVKDMLAGNPANGGAATLIQPGETIGILSKNSLNVTYYPDADAAGITAWTPTNSNVLAFSASGANMIKDNINAINFDDAGKVYTVLGFGDVIDFTINHDGILASAKEEGKIFLGWAIGSYSTGDNVTASISLYGVWAKDPAYEGTSTITEPDDPLAFILDYYIGFISSIIGSINAFIREQMNMLVDHINNILATL